MDWNVETRRRLKCFRGSLLVMVILWLGAATCFSQSSQTSPTKQQEFSEHFAKAQVFLRQRRPDLAIPELEAAVRAEPDHVSQRTGRFVTGAAPRSSFFKA